MIKKILLSLLLLSFLMLCIACESISITASMKNIMEARRDELIQKDTSLNLYSSPAEKFNLLSEDTALSPAVKSIEINTITLSFIGDCMLASYKGEYNWNTFNYRADYEDPSYFFAGVSEIFKNDDFTIANCENIFTDNSLFPVNKGYDGAYWYKSKSANAAIFKIGGIDIISLANNHTYDYGEQGKKDTISAAEAAGLLWGDDSNPVILEKYGFKIALLCVNIMNSRNIDRLLSTMPELKMSADFMIVYFHGGMERVYIPPDNITDTAHRFVDAGAGLVIGHHPHVLQPIETYKGVNIIYSLGNFLFGAGRGENRTIIYQFNFIVADGFLLDMYENIIPCYCFVERWQPAVIKDEEIKKRVMEFLAGKTENPL